MREAGAVAVPLIGDAAREVLEDPELEVDARIERPLRPAEQPALPVGVRLADGRDVLLLRHVPAGAVVVPALADRDDLPDLAAANDLAHTLLIRTAEPLRSHLDH